MNTQAEKALRLATSEICRRLRQRGRRSPPALWPFYDELCGQLRDGTLDTARLRAALGRGPWPAARVLHRFAEACRLEIVSLALHLAGGLVATGRMAAAAGIESYNSYCRIHRAATGRNAALLHVPSPPAFDVFRWHQVVHSTLSPDDAETLARRLADLYPDAFAGGLPEPRGLGEDLASHAAPRPWRLPKIPQTELAAFLKEAAKPLRRRLEREAEELPSPYAETLRFLGDTLSKPIPGCEEICREVGVHDTSFSTKVLFYTGDTLKDLTEKLRLEMALSLLPDRRFTAETIAEAMGVHVRTLRRFSDDWTGTNLSDIHATVKMTFGHPAFEAWLRAEDGELTDDEARRLGGYLLGVHPGAFTPTEALPPLKDAPCLVLFPEIAALPDFLAELASNSSPAGVESRPGVFSRPETEVREDFGKIREVARVLSTAAGGDPESARSIERLYATHSLAPYLYRVREIQCFVTADRLLEAGQIPSAEPWAECLRVMALKDPVPLEDWKTVVGRLVDARSAVELWIEADAERRRLLEKTGKGRIQAIQKGASYLLARTCLFAAERFHRGQGLQGLMLEEDQTAMAMARLLGKRHFSRRSRSRPRRPSVLTDLEVLALARIANDRRIGGNADLAVAAIGEAHKAARKAPVGCYVEAEVASLEASILKDQGLDLEGAEERADEAIRIFETFDVHMAALVKLKKAEILRLRLDNPSFADVEEAIQQLDGSREPRAVEIAHNNLLLYLVEQRRRRTAQHWRRVLPVPSWPVEQANRVNLEGYIEFLWGSIDRAESFLKEAVRLFIQLGMHADAMIALLYLAAIQDLKGLSDQVIERLTEAAQLAAGGGYVIGVSIRELIHQMDSVQNLYERILAIATEAGGCLGPGEPRHPGSN